jgi:hypothetical protein
LRLATPASGRTQRRLSLGFHNWLFRDAKVPSHPILPARRIRIRFHSGVCVARCVDIELTLQASR